MQGTIKQLKDQNRSLQQIGDNLQNRVNQLESQTISQLTRGGEIIYKGYLSSSNTSKTHIFWVGEGSRFDFRLFDISSDADFVIINQDGQEIKDSKKTAIGEDYLNSFYLIPGAYFVKVWLVSSSNSTSYSLKIYRYN